MDIANKSRWKPQ